MRRRFFRRAAILLLLLLGLACGGLTLISSLAARWWGGPSAAHPGPFLAFPLGIVALFLVLSGLVWAARSLRSMAVPIGDMMEAAGRVADGDYAVRVEEYGSAEVRALARAFNSMAERLQDNDTQRRALLADVTHELRTPLTVIQGNLEGLVDGVYPRDDAHLEGILEETRVMSRLIDDLRTLTLAESGALKLQKEPVDLAALLDEMAAFFRPQADAAGVSLALDVAPDLPALDLDATRIREVLSNLIANALRYTPQGGTVTLRSWVERAAETRVVVAVADTGAGIPADDLPHIFDRFYKSRDSQGSGLGLAIARSLVAAHGGAISASSQPGQGTTIRFTLPAG